MAKSRNGSVRKQIDRMVRRIVRRFHPEKIILFGSHARGAAGPDSDVDLLVVMPIEGGKSHKAVEIGVALHGLMVPKDVLVTTPEDFEWRKDTVGTIEYPAWHEGKVLYARGQQPDIEVIVSMMPAACRMWLAPAEQQRLTFYAVATRYPGCPLIPLKEAREAVRVARRVRAEARRVLPRAALRQPKPGGKR